MDDITVLVLSNPADRQLAMLERLPEHTGIAVGDSAEAFERAAPDAAVIFNWSGPGELLRKVFAMSPRVRWVHTRAAGLDRVLFPELVESPVTLTNGSGVFSAPLAEFAMAGILFFAKNLRAMVRNQEAGEWVQVEVAEIAGQTVGIVGYGDIGRTAAARARALGMRVLAVKRHAGGEEGVFGPERLTDVLKEADYIVVSTPLTPQTHGLIGVAEFAAMKPNAVVINLGRGPVIDEQAMVQALRDRRIRGAVLDVFDQEPLPAGHPFYGMENVLLSPHCADHTPDWLERAMQFFLDNFERFRNGEALRNVVDKRLGY